MCDPITIGTTLAIASTATAAVGQYQQAKGQRKALKATATQRASELSDSQEVAIGERVREGRKERARARVAGGEAGLALTSNSFEAQLSDSFQQQGADAAIIRKQGLLDGRALQLDVDSQSASISGDRPLDLLSSGLQIAGAVNKGLSSKPKGG